MSKTLADLKVGDEVCSPTVAPLNRRYKKIVKITATQIVLSDGGRFSLKGLGNGRWNGYRIVPATDEHKQETEKAKRDALVAQKVMEEREEGREARRIAWLEGHVAAFNGIIGVDGAVKYLRQVCEAWPNVE